MLGDLFVVGERPQLGEGEIDRDLDQTVDGSPVVHEVAIEEHHASLE